MSHRQAGLSKQFKIFGKPTLDIIINASSFTHLSDSKHYADQRLGMNIGGAAANIARGLIASNDMWGTNSQVEIVGGLGKMRPQEPGEADEDYLFSQMMYHAVPKLLHNQGIDLKDIFSRNVGTGVAANAVLQHQNGRDIFKDPKSGESVFSNLNVSQRSRLMDTVKTEVASVKGNGFVFVDPRHSNIGSLAAVACEKTAVPLIVDYGDKTWPQSGSQKHEQLSTILTKADILIVPSDAVVEGMANDVKDPDTLFSTLQSDAYKAHTIIMSDGNQPVRVFHEEREYEVQVPDIGDVKLFANGVGDTRDSALMHFLAQGDDMINAVKKATYLASIKVQHAGSEWQKAAVEQTRNHLLFEKEHQHLQAISENQNNSWTIGNS